jgi:glutathione S-transferase
MSALTLYVDAYWISPYAFSAFVALEELKVPYTVKEIALQAGEHRLPGYGSPTGRVPALQHGDFWLAESQAIGEYLAESFPPPQHPRLFPVDVRERAIARQLQAWVRSDLLPIREERPTTTLWYPRTPAAPLSEKGRAAADRLIKALTPLIRPGAGSLFAEWCLADADVGLMLQRLNLNGDPLPAALEAYAEAQWARPSLAKWNSHARIPYVPY